MFWIWNPLTDLREPLPAGLHQAPPASRQETPVPVTVPYDVGSPVRFATPPAPPEPPAVADTPPSPTVPSTLRSDGRVAARTPRSTTTAARPIAQPSAHAPEPASASQSAGLVVITEPEGARVTVNGVGYGATPVTIRYLPPGTQRIRVTKAGYSSEERLVTSGTANAGAELRIALHEASARLPQ